MLWLSGLSLVVIDQIRLVDDDVRATILVNGDPVSLHHLFHPIDCKLSLCNCLLSHRQFLLQLLDFVALHFDLRIKTLSVESSSGFLAKLIVQINLCSSALRIWLKDVYSSTVLSYRIHKISDNSHSGYLLLIIVDASKALAIAGSRSIIRS